MRNAVTLLAIFVVAAVVVTAQPGPTITGVWKPDTTKGSFKMAVLDLRLTITQNENEVLFVQGPQREGAVPERSRYRIGEESENTSPGGNKEKATATWKDGRLIIEGKKEIGAKRILAPFTRVVSVSPDGYDLQIEERTTYPNSTGTSLFAYTREK